MQWLMHCSALPHTALGVPASLDPLPPPQVAAGTKDVLFSPFISVFCTLSLPALPIALNSAIILL